MDPIIIFNAPQLSNRRGGMVDNL